MLQLPYGTSNSVTGERIIAKDFLTWKQSLKRSKTKIRWKKEN